MVGRSVRKIDWRHEAEYVQSNRKRGHLRWHKLEEVILDVETTLNNRPLGYLEDDIQMPILTPTLCCLDSQIIFLKKNQQMLIMTSENAPTEM